MQHTTIGAAMRCKDTKTASGANCPKSVDDEKVLYLKKVVSLLRHLKGFTLLLFHSTNHYSPDPGGVISGHYPQIILTNIPFYLCTTL